MISPVEGTPAIESTEAAPTRKSRKPRVSISLRTNIAEACDLESTRYALGSFQVYPTNAKGDTYIAATDSRILAIAPVDEHCTETTLVSTLPKPSELKKPHRVIADDTGSKIVTGPRYSKPETLHERQDVSVRQSAKVEAKFPRVADVIPDNSDGKRFAVVTLDAELLASLARAINSADNSGKVDLILTLDDGKPEELGATVTGPLCVKGDVGFGLIMPLARKAQDWKDAADARKRFNDAAAAFRSVANAAK